MTATKQRSFENGPCMLMKTTTTHPVCRSTCPKLRSLTYSHHAEIKSRLPKSAMKAKITPKDFEITTRSHQRSLQNSTMHFSQRKQRRAEADTRCRSHKYFTTCSDTSLLKASLQTSKMLQANQNSQPPGVELDGMHASARRRTFDIFNPLQSVRAKDSVRSSGGCRAIMEIFMFRGVGRACSFYM